MRINRIAYIQKPDRKRVQIDYEITQGHDKEGKEIISTYSIDSPEAPRAGFNKTLQALRPYVCNIIEVDEDWQEGLVIRSISYSYKGDEKVMGAVITALKTLENTKAPLIINTPHMTETSYGKNEANLNVLPGGCAELLRKMKREAEKYIKGEKAQLELYTADDEETAGEFAGEETGS